MNDLTPASSRSSNSDKLCLCFSHDASYSKVLSVSFVTEMSLIRYHTHSVMSNYSVFAIIPFYTKIKYLFDILNRPSASAFLLFIGELSITNEEKC